MQDPTIHYAAAIEAVYNAHERYNIAVQTLADAEEAVAELIAEAMVTDVECAAFIAAGKNETDRRDRRTVWTAHNLLDQQEDVRTAKAEKATAEMELEHARNLRSLARLRCEWIMQGGGDLLGPEPPVGRLPAYPRGLDAWPPEDVTETERVVVP